MLDSTCDYYRAVVKQDAVKAPKFTYASTPTIGAIPCSAQPGDVEEVVDEQDRVTKVRHWKLALASPTNARPRDKFVFTDLAGITHTVFAHVERDEAGRGSTYVVHCTEKV